ncbi:hypothetical protein B0H14DRAFT_1453956 [Mycena olivaceomarginata]|nr:hypothetical protein B0H14DRAFT_1453956 [Mycena olivaceomarginata]
MSPLPPVPLLQCHVDVLFSAFERAFFARPMRNATRTYPLRHCTPYTCRTYAIPAIPFHLTQPVAAPREMKSEMRTSGLVVAEVKDGQSGVCFVLPRSRPYPERLTLSITAPLSVVFSRLHTYWLRFVGGRRLSILCSGSVLSLHPLHLAPSFALPCSTSRLEPPSMSGCFGLVPPCPHSPACNNDGSERTTALRARTPSRLFPIL